MTFAQRLARAQVLLGGLAVVVGIAAFVASRHVGFSAAHAPVLGSAPYSVKAMSLNRLGALVVLGLGVIGLAGGLARRPLLGLVPAAGFGLMGAQVLLQWRAGGTNWFASLGSNLSFSMLLCAGFAITAGVAGIASQVDAEAGSTSGRAEGSA